MDSKCRQALIVVQKVSQPPFQTFWGFWVMVNQDSEQWASKTIAFLGLNAERPRSQKSLAMFALVSSFPIDALPTPENHPAVARELESQVGLFFNAPLACLFVLMW